jgi:site-specific DNA-methyltransferase (adenine-specific)/site-specific DNA-methyltransferase (cytosine-N4-specific)
MVNQILCGDCNELIPTILEGSIQLVLTSPPYAQQRSDQYNSIPESEYPEWTVGWMEKCKKVLTPDGSIAIVIRPHIHKGEISDYVLKTRLSIRNAGWKECEELIWIKSDSPPLGSIRRPRRAWESILWYSLLENPFCDPKANGQASNRVGFISKKGVGEYKNGTSKPEAGISRCPDYVMVGTSKVDKSQKNMHPAQFPEDLAAWIIRLLSSEGSTVLDPFLGSGTTAVAAVKNSRHFVGIELSLDYCNYARSRLTLKPSYCELGHS